MKETDIKSVWYPDIKSYDKENGEKSIKTEENYIKKNPDSLQKRLDGMDLYK